MSVCSCLVICLLLFREFALFSVFSLYLRAYQLIERSKKTTLWLLGKFRFSMESDNRGMI